jgi:solute carrier family 44 (choline transporter-like protein), member 2/4/5
MFNIRTLQYHMGSIAFGSLVIAIVQLMRIIMVYITKQAENMGGDSRIKKIILAIINCMLWCLEKCIKFISKNSYIYTAIKGTSFCWSAFQSFRLIYNNLARFGMTTLVSEIILLLCKATSVSCCTVAGYIWLTYDTTYTIGENMVTRPIIPLLCIILFAFIISTSFFNVIDLCIDTILLNYCIDLERKKKGFKLAAAHKLGKIPLKGNEKEQKEVSSEMDPACCKCCTCCNYFIQRLCCDSKKKKTEEVGQTN